MFYAEYRHPFFCSPISNGFYLSSIGYFLLDRLGVNHTQCVLETKTSLDQYSGPAMQDQTLSEMMKQHISHGFSYPYEEQCA